MPLMIYNSLTRRKEPFESIEPGRVRMYVCGPTVYDKAHVGHAMSSIVFDVIRRYLEYKGYQVKHVMNYTDVEDKVIRRAKDLGMDPLALGERYRAEYDQHLRDLNILPATLYPRASEEIGAILEMVNGLVDKGYAYVVDGEVYFEVSRDEDYGRLSGRRVEDMRAGLRLEVDERKKDPADFALWKAAKPGEPAWDSPWGRGRPGWHIECSAMIRHHLGEQIDVHGGGNDLVFPHHENEIAQSESLTGRPLARYWVHNGMLQLRGEKMSKSIGNLVTVDEFLSRREGEALRMVVLNSGYRSPLTFTDEVVGQAERALERLRAALKPAVPGENPAPEAEALLADQVAATRAGFLAGMDDDFNTPAALGQLFDLVRGINQARDAGAGAAALGSAQNALRELTGVLGLRLETGRSAQQQAGPFIELLLQLREELRRAKQWALADRIRDRLAELGVTLEDGKDGTTWKAR
jgi:cysteinyl-tRNA synthetase